MKKIRDLSEDRFLKLFFAFFSACFLIGAVCMPGVQYMFKGFMSILLLPCKICTNYFYVGGFSATFLNMGLVGLFCTGLCFLPGAKVSNVTTLALLLTVGFASWGVNVLNMLPSMLGVCLYCFVKKEKLGTQINAMMFSTGIAPLISELLFRYPTAGYLGFNWLGAILALLAGLLIGFFLPAGLGHAPNIHRGFNHFSAAVPIGFTAFFLRTVLYNVMLGKKIGNLGALQTLNSPKAEFFLGCNLFCITLFAVCIGVALLMGCKPKGYLALMKDPGKGVSFTSKYGNAPFLMNVGVYGLMIVAYFNFATWIDGSASPETAWTGMTFGIVFCMLCTCNSGSHPLNVLPIMVGYIVTSFVFGGIFKLLGGETYGLSIGSQSILIGMCFANGLSPISGTYGFGFGVLAGGLHYLLVSAVPDLHGGFCLYNGGFTAAMICLLLVPQLEKFCKTKAERKELCTKKL